MDKNVKKTGQKKRDSVIFYTGIFCRIFESVYIQILQILLICIFSMRAWWTLMEIELE